VKGIHQRILASLAVVVIITTLGVMAHQYTSLDWLVSRETRLREFVQTHPVQSWLIGFLIYTSLSLVPGMAGKSVICGWLFGFWGAVLMVDGALTVAALATFFASRFLLRDWVESRFGMHLVRFRRRLESSAGFYLLMLRLFHTPFSFVNYAAGATNIVRPRTFWWTTHLGILPSTMILVFAGTRIPSLSKLADRGFFALLDSSLIAALAATSILPLIVKWIATAVSRRRAARNADGDSESRQTLT